ncbi:MAG: methyltransferase domain-containing protein [Phycisphaerae bacterium]|nr:methyltransferase domain-containing protein [Phycisphaerae bacterium]
MDWAKDYYTQQSRTFARATVTDQHRRIAQRLHGWCGERDGVRRILELGAGMAGVAAALADRGYDVCAVEFNPADATLARSLASQPRAGGLTIVEDDFYTVDLPGRFDFIYYWDGFGIGTDDDQRRLLRRIGQDWLAADGRALIDVFSPWNWRRRHGERSTFTARDGSTWERRIEYETHGERFRDHWSTADDPTVHRSQTIRCYTPLEFEDLARETGLAVDRFIAMDGYAFSANEITEEIRATNGFYVLLQPCPMR